MLVVKTMTFIFVSILLISLVSFANAGSIPKCEFLSSSDTNFYCSRDGWTILPSSTWNTQYYSDIPHTGPQSFDSETFSPNNNIYYLFFNPSINFDGFQAVYASKIETTNGMSGSCAQFYLNMNGIDMGSLFLVVEHPSSNNEQASITLIDKDSPVKNSARKEYLIKEGDQGPNWFKVKQDLPFEQSQSFYRVYFQVIKGSSTKSQVSFDNVEITLGACDPSATTTPSTTTNTTTPPSTTTNTTAPPSTTTNTTTPPSSTNNTTTPPSTTTNTTTPPSTTTNTTAPPSTTTNTTTPPSTTNNTTTPPSTTTNTTTPPSTTTNTTAPPSTTTNTTMPPSTTNNTTTPPSTTTNTTMPPSTTTNTTGASITPQVVAGWSSWGSYTQCSISGSTCGWGIQNKTRTCTLPAINGSFCTLIDGKNTGLTETVESDCYVSCPANAVYGSWSAWNTTTYCNATCGGGYETVTRTCTFPPPSGGMLCLTEASTRDTSEVKIQMCNTYACVNAANYGNWNAWSACSGTCGFGKMTRTRSCVGACNNDLKVEIRDCSSGCRAYTCPDISDYTYYCNFETTCGKDFSHDPSDGRFNNIDKTTGNSASGPIKDKTMPTAGCGNFVYFDSSGTSLSPSFLISPSILAPTGQQCVSFYINMFSENYMEMGTLKVMFYQQTFTGHVIEVVWESSVNLTTTNTDWYHVNIDLFNIDNSNVYYIVFVAEKPNGSINSDIAIDDFSARNGLCSAKVDGFWSAWENWGSCSNNCGSGMQTRKRTCDAPLPRNGGAACAGLPTESRTCTGNTNCQSKGVWNNWGLWRECSVSCDNGTRTRERICSTFGATCLKLDGTYGIEDVQSEDCKMEDCSLDGVWGEWGPYEQCSKTCGTGATKTRSRRCNNPEPRGTGSFCLLSDQSTQRKYDLVESGRISCTDLPACPIHGNWGNWTESSCSVTCNNGTKTRSRSCDNPTPANNGLWCANENGINQTLFQNQTVSCIISVCPQNATWVNTGVSSQCNVTCGHGNKTVEQECQAAVGGAPVTTCDGRNAGEKKNITTPCTIWLNTKEQSCDVKGKWGEWGNYSTCPVDCGGATQVRTRHCDSPPPSGNGVACEREDGVTTLIDQRSKPCDCDGKWSDWKCVCDENAPYKNETRTCSNPAPQGTGTNCTKRDNTTGLYEVWENRTCLCQNPVNGNWTEWTAFSLCSASCGAEAVRTRTRNCSEPLYGGKECLKLDNTRALYEVNIENCSLPCCRVDATWQSWWLNTSSCNATCENGGNGMGFFERVRNCSGDSCNGIKLCSDGIGYASKQTTFIACEENCTRNGDWGNYTDITPCNASCGYSIKVQRRNCSNPTPRANGLECLFEDKKGRGLLENRTVQCENIPPCPINGVWSTWMVWSNCSKACNGYGNTTRTRYCNNPPPQYGGNNCSKIDGTTGLSEIQSQTCYIYCQDPYACDFEAQNFCRFTTYDQTPSIANRWLIESGETHTKSVGPDEAQEGLYYAYFESSDDRPRDFPGAGTEYGYKNESIALKNLPAFNGQRCLSFYYFAWQNVSKSTNFGYLSVKQISHMNGIENSTTILSISQPQEREWKHVLFNLVNQGYSYDIVFEAKAENHLEDKAIDNVHFYPVNCSVYNSTEIPVPSN